jgi:hypothetical protein
LYAIAVLTGRKAPQPFEPAREVALVGKPGCNGNISDRLSGREHVFGMLYAHLPEVHVWWDSDSFSKDAQEMIATKIGEFGKTIERHIFGVVAFDIVFKLCNGTRFFSHTMQEWGVVGMSVYQLCQYFQQRRFLLNQWRIRRFQLAMYLAKVLCHRSISDNACLEKWKLTWSASNIGGNMLEYRDVKIEHSIAPAFGDCRLPGMRLVWDAQVNVARQGNDMLATIEIAQCTLLDDTYCIALVCMPREGLRKVCAP